MPGGDAREDMEPTERHLQRVERDVDDLILQFEKIADVVDEIEYADHTINVREFFQRVISRYQFEREENIQSSENANPPDGDLTGIRVLTIEDDSDISTLLTLILEASGAEVACLSSAPPALELLQTESFTVVVSDLGMPEMSGLEFMRRLRAKGNHVPSIALSAYSAPEDKEASLSAGFDLFVAKPVHPAVLVSGISKLVAASET